MDESILDDEEEWHAQSDGEVDSIASEGEGVDEDDDEDDEAGEMVIEQPFEDAPQGALLDVSHTETMLETPRSPQFFVGP